VEKDKDARICCKSGIAGLSEIKKMSWFDGVDWELLEAKKITPPMRPDVSLHILIVIWCWVQYYRQGKGNFDPAHELEEILLDDNPLRAKRRTKEFDTMSPEMKRMEEQCVPRHTHTHFTVRLLITSPDSCHSTSGKRSSSTSRNLPPRSLQFHTGR